MAAPRATVLVTAFALTLALAPAAEAARLPFTVLSVKGQQTANWNDRQQSGCGSVSRSGSQTISFESTHKAKLSLLRIPRYTPSGKRRGFTYYGTNFVRSNWTLSRTFSQGPQPQCPVEPASAAQASDCGTRGPYPIPVDIAWRAGAIELRAASDKNPHPFKSCEYAGFHEFDLIFSKGRLSQRRLTSGRRTIRVTVKGHLKEPGAESEGSQTTSLTATVTLRRRR